MPYDSDMQPTVVAALDSIAPVAVADATSETNQSARPIQKHARYRPDVDGLRAVAILSVVAFHAFPGLLPGGFVGVDIFFVISGFLISQIILSELADSKFSFASFYSRRIRRIFPSLFVTLAMTLLLGWFFLPPELFQSLGKHTVAGSAFSANLLDWNEAGYFDTAAENKPLLHLWSLGIEEQFYIFWPLLLWGTWRMRSWQLAMFAVLAVASFSANVHLTHADAQGAFYLPHARFWELLVGCLLAYASLPAKAVALEKVKFLPLTQISQRKADFLRETSSVAGFASICISMVVINKGRFFPGWWALLPTIGAALMIAAGPSAWLNRKLLSSRAFVWIGLISFQLYLWHWPLLVFLRTTSVGVPSIGQRMFVVGASFLLAWLTFAFIDKPIRFGRRLSTKTVASCAALVVTAIVGCVVYALHGLPSRYPQSVQALAAFKYSYAENYREGSCFLKPEQRATEFVSCTDASSGRSILLWGDSHAAHLYPGLKNGLNGTARLTQLTASMCPPFLHFDVDNQPNCRQINAYVVDQISRQPPDEVILGGFWEAYDWKLLSPTIEYLKQIGVKSIIVVGPVPRWSGDLTSVIYQYLSNNPTMKYVPQWMKFGLAPETRQVDKDMAAYAAGLGVDYVSAIATLCNDEGCLTRTGETFDSITAWDRVHLTTAGSIYLVSHSGMLTNR